MSDELVLYTNPMSRGRVVRWVLEEIGQPYHTELLEYGTTMKEPVFLAINPMGKVPALRHGDTIITETAAICAYLADAFPEAKLAPAVTDRLRGDYYRWLFFMAGPFEAAISNRSMGFEPNQEQQKMSGYGNASSVLTTLEKVLSQQEYLVGDGFTAVDIYAGANLGWGMAFGNVEKRPVFEQYWQRLSQRPAFVRASEIDDILLAKAS